MTGFFKKALGVFVEFDDDADHKDSSSQEARMTSFSNEITRDSANHAEAEKFEKYFDRLFDQANLPGPDYFEFFKMMETLEVHIPDERARLSATFASLSIQGMTKQILIDTANKYKALIEKDRADFDLALKEKINSEVGARQKELTELGDTITSNSEQIQKLTKEISDAQVRMKALKSEVAEEETKLNRNGDGYKVASQAILSKISSDIQKIQTTL
jgi:hypothetical protein